MRRFFIRTAIAFMAISAPVFAHAHDSLSGDKIVQIFRDKENTISRENKAQVQSAVAALNALKANEIVYVCCPISSGKRLYEYMDLHGYRTIDEAKKDKEAFHKAVRLPNIEDANFLGDSLAKNSQGFVITPSSFDNKKVPSWRHNEFMSMWLSAIENSVTRMVMIDGWEYSNGAGEEFLWATLMQKGFLSRSNIEIVDEKGVVISQEQGTQLLKDALAKLHQKGLNAKLLEEVVFLLEQLH